MSFRRNAILLAPVAGLLAVVLAGCGSAGITIDPVAQAAVATGRAGGAQMSMRASIEVEGLPSTMTMSGSGDFNFAGSEGQIQSELTGLPAAASGALHGTSIQFTELYAKGDLYMQSSLFTSRLPGGARWMKLDLPEVAQATGLDVQSLTSGQSNPAQVLQYLKASGGTITKVGTATIRGTRTTHYRATIDLAKAIKQEVGPTHGQAKQALEELGSTTVPAEVWVDSHNLVRRMSMSLSESAAGQHVKLALELELFNFGAVPTVRVPASSEVFDATQSSLSALAGGS